MRLLWPEAALEAAAAGLASKDASQATTKAGVEFATGDSDEDSIRDYGSGPGKVKFFRRKPYWYRRATNLENMTYRRRVRPRVFAEGLGWEDEYASGSDGDNEQPSFAPPQGEEISADGEMLGPSPDVQPTVGGDGGRKSGFGAVGDDIEAEA